SRGSGKAREEPLDGRTPDDRDPRPENLSRRQPQQRQPQRRQARQAFAWPGRRAAAAAGWRCLPARTWILPIRARRVMAAGFLAARWVRMAQLKTVREQNVLCGDWTSGDRM